MAGADNEGSDVVKTLAQLFALVAGFIGLVYAAGGGVLALRLYLQHLPSRAVVGQLPRELLVSIGLAQIVLPVLGVAAFYATIRLLIGTTPPPTRLVSQWKEQSLRGWIVLIAVCAVPALVAAGWVASRGDTRGGLHALPWLLSVTFLFTLLVLLVALNLRGRLAARYGEPTSLWNSRRPIVWMMLVVAFASLPAWLILAGTNPLRRVKVCTTSGSEVIGVLIGETSDRTYVGDTPDKNKQNTVARPVFSIPQGQIVETIIGGPDDSEPGPHPSCPAPSSTSG